MHAALRRIGSWSVDAEEVRPLLPDSAWRSFEACRGVLERAGALVGDGSVADFDARAAGLEVMAEQKRHAYARLAQMTSFATLRSCRHARIADYFGEQGVARTCQACDNCLAGSRPAGAAVAGEVVRAALAGAARFSGRIGLVNLAAVLGGRETKWTREHGWVREVPAYNTLPNWSEERVRRLFTELIDGGLVGQTPGQYPMVMLTDLGREVLAGRSEAVVSLLERHEAALARQQERRPRRLQPWDYLVAVSDLLRMGALRLFSEEADRYLRPADWPAPPAARLRTLQLYAERAERGERLSPQEEEIALLIAPGRSLGGARPKANFDDGHELWIAKFLFHNDRRDMGAWELVLNRLAGAAGIEVPESRLCRLGDTFHTFAARRF